MVLKPMGRQTAAVNPFENGVVLDGTQTDIVIENLHMVFENGVVLDGTQTVRSVCLNLKLFENGVVLDGTQTIVSDDYVALAV